MCRDLQCIFTFTLRTIRVDRGARQVSVVQEVIEEISGLLVVDKYDGASRRHGEKQVKQAVTLLGFVNKDHLLRILSAFAIDQGHDIEPTRCMTFK